MPDASRFPEGLLLTGTDVTVAAPVGTIKQDAAGRLVRSTNAAAAAYSGLNGMVANQTIADPGTGVAIPVTASGCIVLTIAAGAETNTLAAPGFIGQELYIIAGAVGGGTRAITSAVPINQAGNTTMTFNAVDDFIILRGVPATAGALEWRIVVNESVALS